MASINGFCMKNIHRTRGMEGYGATASIYLDGMRIGTYADYADGGPADVEYFNQQNKEVFERFLIDYAEKHPVDYIVENIYNNEQRFEEDKKSFLSYHPHIKPEKVTKNSLSGFGADIIAYEFLKLYDLEQEYKKAVKKGYRGISYDGAIIVSYPADWSDERIINDANGSDIYLSPVDFVK